MTYDWKTFTRTQDWEITEEVSPNEWETIDLQIDTEEEAMIKAKQYANETNHRMSVSTSIRIVNPVTNSVEDRDTVEGNLDPIMILPDKYEEANK